MTQAVPQYHTLNYFCSLSPFVLHEAPCKLFVSDFESRWVGYFLEHESNQIINFHVMKIQLQHEPQSAELLQIAMTPSFDEGFKSTIVPCQAPRASNFLIIISNRNLRNIRGDFWLFKWPTRSMLLIITSFKFELVVTSLIQQSLSTHQEITP